MEPIVTAMRIVAEFDADSEIGLKLMVKEITEAIEAAVLAEQKRCGDIARRSVSGYGAWQKIMFGEEQK